MIRQARILLIRFARVFPFAICVFVIVSYIEAIYSISFSDYSFIASEHCFIPTKHLSWIIGNMYTYNMWTVFVALFLAVCFETCLYNRLSIVYLMLNLMQRRIFLNIEVTETTAIAVSLINIVCAMYLVYKGCKNALFAKIC